MQIFFNTLNAFLPIYRVYVYFSLLTLKRAFHFFWACKQMVVIVSSIIIQIDHKSTRIMHIKKLLYIYIYIYTCICIYIYVCVCVCVCMCVCVCVFIYVCIHKKCERKIKRETFIHNFYEFTTYVDRFKSQSIFEKGYKYIYIYIYTRCMQ